MPGLGTSFGRGGATTAQQDLANADAILIMGSSMAENHPVGFQWVMEARERGAKIIHVDPRFTRTSAMADIWVPLRAGTDILFLGGLIQLRPGERQVFPRVRRALHQRSLDDSRRLRDTEDLGGVFSGWDEDKTEIRSRRPGCTRAEEAENEWRQCSRSLRGRRRTRQGSRR